MFTPVSAFTAAKLSRNSIAMTNVCQKKKKKQKNKNQEKLYVVIINKN
jgi:hypothetical protein